MFRKTVATLVAGKFGPDAAALMLAHAPRTIAAKHYVAADPHALDNVLEWLERELFSDSSE